MGVKEDKPNTPKKPFIYYYTIMMVVLMALNLFLMPMYRSSQVTEVPYSTFLDMVDQGVVTSVERSDDEIVFLVKTGNKTVFGDDEIAQYKTGPWPDNNLEDTLRSHKVQFTTPIIEQPSALMTILVQWVVPILLFVAVGQFMGKQLQKRMGGSNAMTFGKSNAKIYAESETGKTFADVAGAERPSAALLRYLHISADHEGNPRFLLTHLSLPLLLPHPQKYADIGATLPKGALLVGPPGTGKTLLAKAVAGEAKVPFFSISGSEFVEMFVGMGAAKVRDLFKQANEKAPCIVFIDEIDTIGKKRDGSGMGGNDEREQTLNQLLTEMDGFDGKKGVVILAATNRPESLDPALLRPGRFDRRIPVELPDIKGRESILRVHAKDVKMDDTVDFTAIARATSGASGAELANIINEGALRAVRMGRKVVSQQDLEESVEVVIAGYQKKDSAVSEDEKKIVSYHEVGHALVAACQSHSAPVHKITIIPRTSGALGYTMQVDQAEKYLMSKDEVFNKIATLTGGRAAEELIFHSITTGASNDIEQATKLARAMVTRYGMNDQFGMVALETVNNQYLGGDTSLACSPETARVVDEEVIKLVKEAYKKAMEILAQNEGKLHEIAAYLLEKETITGDEFMEILNRKEETKTESAEHELVTE